MNVYVYRRTRAWSLVVVSQQSSGSLKVCTMSHRLYSCSFHHASFFSLGKSTRSRYSSSYERAVEKQGGKVRDRHSRKTIPKLLTMLQIGALGGTNFLIGTTSSPSGSMTA